jgi:hypothetical protein
MGTLHKHLRTLPQLSVLGGRYSDANVPTRFTRQRTPDAFLTPIVSQIAPCLIQATSTHYFYNSELSTRRCPVHDNISQKGIYCLVSRSNTSHRKLFACLNLILWHLTSGIPVTQCEAQTLNDEYNSLPYSLLHSPYWNSSLLHIGLGIWCWHQTVSTHTIATQIMVFWILTPCNYYRWTTFERMCCLNLQGQS